MVDRVRFLVFTVRQVAPNVMQHFSLFACGEFFDVDACLATTLLGSDRVWHRGDPVRDDHHIYSGFEKLLGDGSVISFRDQQPIAIDFIAQHREALRAMAVFPGVEVCSLRLQYQMELTGNVWGFVVSVWPKLNWHALDVGLEIDCMVVLERDLGWTKVPFKDNYPD
ncbi:MAG: hypothetical protein JWM11_3940 [Planctomycetaceae bacterium]|nr:hypothetical protein [Planctomycetaceae bacterium]